METNYSQSDALLATRDKLAAAAAAARRRRTTTTAVLVLVVLVVFGYFAFAYSQLAQLDAQTVVAAVETQFQPVLNQPPQEIATYMEQQAPQIVEQVVELVKQAPDTLATQGRDYLWQQADQTLAELEEELYQGVVAAVRQAKVEGQAHTGGPVTPEALDAILKDLTTQIAARVRVALDHGQQRYQAQSADILGYLDHLASGQDLTPLDRLHRQIFTDFLALMEVWQQTGGDGNAVVTPVLAQ